MDFGKVICVSLFVNVCLTLCLLFQSGHDSSNEDISSRKREEVGKDDSVDEKVNKICDQHDPSEYRQKFK